MHACMQAGAARRAPHRFRAFLASCCARRSIARASSPTEASNASLRRCSSFSSASCAGLGFWPFGSSGGGVVAASHSARCSTVTGQASRSSAASTAGSSATGDGASEEPEAAAGPAAAPRSGRCCPSAAAQLKAAAMGRWSEGSVAEGRPPSRMACRWASPSKALRVARSCRAAVLNQSWSRNQTEVPRTVKLNSPASSAP
mmetsp:Transcript_77364/g.239595  ORF Transcript_77364/g.239595 Transcript_77364/m.239595 type:complete len:201 (+) Transcript_77364:55-657(+)